MAKTVKKEVKKKATQAEINHAEFLYCEKKMTPDAICKLLERDIKTIYAWRDKYNWDEARELFDTGPTSLKKLLLYEAIHISEGNPPGIDADSLSKVMKAFDYMNKQASPSVCRDVIIDLENFIALEDPEFALKCTDFNRRFLIHRINLDAGKS